MLYVVVYHLDGVVGPGGHIASSRAESVEFAAGLAVVALDLLGDYVSEVEWFDLNGELSDPFSLLKSNSVDQVADVISQVSDYLKGRKSGHLDVVEYDDLFELAKNQDVGSWAPGLGARILELRSTYHALVEDLSQEWSRL